MDNVMIVTAALIDATGRVLISKRAKNVPEAEKWEFPGGKVNASETPQAAMIRELHEELGINTQESCLAPLSFVTSPINDQQTLVILLYVIRVWQGEVSGKEGQPLQWVKPLRLGNFDMPKPNQHLVAMLRDLLG